MRYFPMFLDMAGRTVLLAGGGEQIAQKARLLKRTEARLALMAEELIPELRDLVEAGRAAHVAADLAPEAIDGADYVFIATEDDDLDAEIADHARGAGAVVNMIDKPDQCDMITPALVDRDPVVVAIGTEGAAPVLAKAIKTSLEQMLPGSLGPFIAMIGRQRDLVAASVEGERRLAFWNWAVKGAPWRRWLAGDEAGAEAMIAEAASDGGAPQGAAGGFSMIEIPAAPDLAPLRAVQRLQEAAVILHPKGIDEGLFDLARRDALRKPLTGCPRHDAEARDALRAAEGPVVALVTPECRPLEGMEDAELIPAARLSGPARPDRASR